MAAPLVVAVGAACWAVGRNMQHAGRSVQHAEQRVRAHVRQHAHARGEVEGRQLRVVWGAKLRPDGAPRGAPSGAPSAQLD
jgi:predicted nucleic acid-binding Zn ribbon protein